MRMTHRDFVYICGELSAGKSAKRFVTLEITLGDFSPIYSSISNKKYNLISLFYSVRGTISVFCHELT